MRVRVDANRPLASQPGTGHNRWHPDLEPIASIASGDVITLETRDGLDGQIRIGSTADALASIRFGRSHPLTGPVLVEGAEPGGLLEVEIVAVETADFGYTGIIPGFGLLADLYPSPYLLTWEIADGRARSADLPGVSIPLRPFPGQLGVAPSAELLEEVVRREHALAASGAWVAEPSAVDAWPPEAAKGLTTIPPRENGGNLDLRHADAGCTLLLPVFVAGALFSAGDLHAAQGDGEVCGMGIEVAGALTVRLTAREPGGWRPRFPAYAAPKRVSRAEFVTTGIPLEDSGANASLDLTLSARRAVVELVDWLETARGLSREAAYVLASVAADLRIAEVVDAPNTLVTAALPLDVFDD